MLIHRVVGCFCALGEGGANSGIGVQSFVARGIHLLAALLAFLLDGRGGQGRFRRDFSCKR